MRECGRSMVEMLGVLAIIGVLSVGAIAGYSKAMFKYKLNKHAESFSMLLSNAIQIKPELNRAFGGTSFGANLFDKLNLIPDGMTYKNNYIYDIFGNYMTLAYAKHTTGGQIDYYLAVNIDQTNNAITSQSAEICKNIVTVAKGYASDLTALSMRSGEDYSSYSATVFYGDESCTSERKCLRNAQVQQIWEFCNYCQSEDYCGFVIYFMIEH